MKVPKVEAPVSLLLDQKLTPSAKVIWLVTRLTGTAEPAGLQAGTGLSRPTVLNARNSLGNYPESGGATVPIPGDLLTDRRVSAQAKVLYGALQLTQGFRHPDGRFTYAALGELTGTGINTVKRATAALKDAGWLQMKQATKRTPISFTLLNPIDRRGRAEVALARRRIRRAPSRGEGLMREFLSLLAASDTYADNARPGFLTNPLTGESMELDRFYPPSVAFEYNGSHHDDPEQMARDLMKIGLCAIEGIKLQVIRSENLSLKSMQQKVSQVLPLRDLTGREALIAFLEAESRRYRREK